MHADFFAKVDCPLRATQRVSSRCWLFGSHVTQAPFLPGNGCGHPSTGDHQGGWEDDDGKWDRVPRFVRGLLPVWISGAEASLSLRQFGQYQGAGVLTGFGLRLRHLAQRKRLPFTAVFGRFFFPVLGQFFDIGASVCYALYPNDAFGPPRFMVVAPPGRGKRWPS